MNSLSVLLVICLLSCFSGLNRAQNTICSSVEQNVDYKGNDFTFTYDAKSVDGCANLCSILSQSCKGFTFWTISSTNSICFLKNFTRTPLRYPAKNRQSCIMVKNPNPTGISTTATTFSTSTSSSTTTLSSSDSTPISTTTLSSSFSTDTTPTTISTTTTITTTTTPYTGPATQAKCLFENNSYYGDALVAFDFKNANSLGECCDLCSSYGASVCAQFSYLQDSLICYIYASPLPEKQSRANTTGGSLNPSYGGYARIHLN